jgi:serine phosphatase RsbU (regulator of sigma subunit)
VRELTGGRRLPLGLEDSAIDVGEEMLEPGDRLLLYTDGMVEACDRWGEMFGVERLVDLTEQAQQAQLPTPETLRKLTHRVADFRDGPPRDDALIMFVEWSVEAARRVLP